MPFGFKHKNQLAVQVTSMQIETTVDEIFHANVVLVDF